MTPIPRLPGFDHTIQFLREGYDFLPRRFERLGSDVIEARLLLQRTICMRGSEAAAVFYDPSRFERRDAAPRRVVNTLLGRHGIQGLDGEQHRERKAMFMSLMDQAAIAELVERFRGRWLEALPRWAAQGRVDLVVEVRELLTRVVCEWAGVPIADAEVGRRASQLAALIDAPGGVGPRFWRGRLARIQTDLWISGVIAGIRVGSVVVPEGSAAQVIASHRERGEWLPLRVAAVELINVLRPTAAIDRYIAMIVRALHEHAGRVEQIDGWSWDQASDVEAFVQEVRRHYPFFPAVVARVSESFEWQGHQFPRRRRVLLDIDGTNHHPREWPNPNQFLPERFRGRPIDPFALIPQGGGDHFTNHRCAGEWLTIAVMAEATRLLTREMSYTISAQSSPLDRGRVPAQPPTDLILEEVRAGALADARAEDLRLHG
jgi:fatty-acid peroxygenase